MARLKFRDIFTRRKLPTKQTAVVWRRRLQHKNAWLAAAAIAAVGGVFIWHSFAATPDPSNADLNGDKVINLADLSLLLTYYGKSGTGIKADINADGAVNLADLSVLLANYGKNLGTVVPLPTNLKAVTGGDSIAVTWNPATAEAMNYNVLRDGVKIATTMPDDHDRLRVTGTLYVDHAITAGRTYTYTVQAVKSSGVVSNQTPSVTATVPTSTTPVPQVVLDPSFAQFNPNNVAWMQKYGVPDIETWYPKIADIFAKGGYTPIHTITIKSLSSNDFVKQFNSSSAAAAKGDVIWINPSGFELSEERNGYTLVHESVHVLQNYANGIFDGPTPRWFVEGMADYAAYLVANAFPYEISVFSTVNSTSYYFDGYTAGAYFLNYITTHYDPNYVRNANIASHNGTYDINFVQFSDGKNTDEAWAALRGTTSQTGHFVNRSSNKCLAAPGSNMSPGALMILYTCNPGYGERITYHKKNDTSYALVVYGQCLEESGTGNNAYVWLNYCNGLSLAESWFAQSNGTITNLQSKRCLSILNGSTSSNDNQRIVVEDCNGGAYQKWNLP
jgi:hypothetical protein